MQKVTLLLSSHTIFPFTSLSTATVKEVEAPSACILAGALVVISETEFIVPVVLTFRVDCDNPEEVAVTTHVPGVVVDLSRHVATPDKAFFTDVPVTVPSPVTENETVAVDE